MEMPEQRMYISGVPRAELSRQYSQPMTLRKVTVSEVRFPSAVIMQSLEHTETMMMEPIPARHTYLFVRDKTGHNRQNSLQAMLRNLTVLDLRFPSVVIT